MSEIMEYRPSQAARSAFNSLERWHTGREAYCRTILDEGPGILRTRGDSMSQRERDELERDILQAEIELFNLEENRKVSPLLRWAAQNGIKYDNRDGVSIREIRGYGPQSEPAIGATRTASQMPTLYGYGALFGHWTDIGSYYQEMIAPGAFSEPLERGDDVTILVNHDPNQILGRTRAVTARLRQDRTGLYFECPLNNDTLSQDVEKRIRRGDLAGCSFSFIVGEDSWEPATKRGELDRRTILKVSQLFDTGPVVFPAYQATWCGIALQRNEVDFIDGELPEDEKWWITDKHLEIGKRLRDIQERLKAAQK